MTWKKEHNTHRNSEWHHATAKLFRVSVVHGHHVHPKRWVMHCDQLNIDTLPLTATTADEAKAEAVAIVRGILSEALAELEGET